jgi:F-type H+-transporting ATPase subunit gamma
MASTREIRDRINSIKSTMKITNAMYMISSTKMNNARKALASTEPYFFALQAMFTRVVRHLPEGFHHPYLDKRETDDPYGLRRAVICVTADKGLAGAYNHNVLKKAEEGIRPDANDKLFVVGEVGRQYFMNHNVNVDGEFNYTAQKPTQRRARQIASTMLDLFGNNEIDEVYIVYTEMKNSMESETVVRQLLPLIRLHGDAFSQQIYQLSGGVRETFNLEPNPTELLNNIVPPWITGYIYSALVESYCAEHSARMQAMDAANKNGNELLSALSIQYNRERQARITQEITEVAAGAKARMLQQSRKES